VCGDNNGSDQNGSSNGQEWQPQTALTEAVIALLATAVTASVRAKGKIPKRNNRPAATAASTTN